MLGQGESTYHAQGDGPGGLGPVVVKERPRMALGVYQLVLWTYDVASAFLVAIALHD